MIFSGIFNYWLSTGGIISLINSKVNENFGYIAIIIIYFIVGEVAPSLAFSHAIAGFCRITQPDAPIDENEVISDEEDENDDENQRQGNQNNNQNEPEALEDDDQHEEALHTLRNARSPPRGAQNYGDEIVIQGDRGAAGGLGLNDSDEDLFEEEEDVDYIEDFDDIKSSHS